MSRLMAKQIDLYNITESNVSSVIFNRSNGINEYIIPVFKLKSGIPSDKNISYIKSLVESINPDVVHIWGIEKYWALLFSRGYIDYEPIIEIQGLLSSCYDVYWGGMTPKEILSTIGLKEIIKPCSSLIWRKKKLESKARYEKEVLSAFNSFSTQSQWTRNQLKCINANANTYCTRRPIRKEFWSAPQWRSSSQGENLIIFTSISYYEPFKGFHILLRAVKELVKRNKNVELRIAGPDLPKISNIRLGGYERMLLDYIYNNNLSNNVKFLGKLNSEGIVQELSQAQVFVNPSLVESFSASTAEALCLGVPSVISYAGAMPEFNILKDTLLSYSPCDYKSCAAHIENIIYNSDLQSTLSRNSINVMRDLASDEIVIETQLAIYKKHLELINL